MTTQKDYTPKISRRFKRWPIELKRRIVEETFAPGASVSIVARRHDANANQVFGWRKQYQQGLLVDKTAKTHDLIRVASTSATMPPSVPSAPWLSGVRTGSLPVPTAAASAPP
jgi:transposase